MEKNLEKNNNNKKKTREENVQRKGNYFKGARREEIIEFLGTKTLPLYQSILSPRIAFFLTIFKGYKCNKFMWNNFKEKILMGARENRLQIS